jgi:hypothetical protein
MDILTRREIEERLFKATRKAKRHAKTCHDCYVPIMDDEGNPQYVSEACAKGAVILQDYIAIEGRYFAMQDFQ